MIVKLNVLIDVGRLASYDKRLVYEMVGMVVYLLSDALIGDEIESFRTE